MNPEREPEERLILSLLEGDPLAHEPEDAAGASLARGYVELLGLLPYELAAAEPPARLRERLLAEAARGAAGGRPAAGAARVAPISRRPPAAAPVRTAGWPLALAASLLLAALGTSGWLYSRLQASEARVAELEARVEAIGREQAALAARHGAMDPAAALALINAPGTELCRLRPVGDRPLQPVARGILYIAADHQHWYLRLTGLDPLPADRVYRVWFRTPEGPVAAGSFRTAAGADAELGSPTMPAGTSAVVITLEPAGDGDRPSGPEVLYGEDRMTLL